MMAWVKRWWRWVAIGVALLLALITRKRNPNTEQAKELSRLKLIAEHEKIANEVTRKDHDAQATADTAFDAMSRNDMLDVLNGKRDYTSH